MRDAVLRAASSSSMAACTPHPLRRVCREGGFVPFSSLLPRLKKRQPATSLDGKQHERSNVSGSSNGA
jgi:hypothetical protein